MQEDITMAKEYGRRYVSYIVMIATVIGSIAAAIVVIYEMSNMFKGILDQYIIDDLLMYKLLKVGFGCFITSCLLICLFRENTFYHKITYLNHCIIVKCNFRRSKFFMTFPVDVSLENEDDSNYSFYKRYNEAPSMEIVRNGEILLRNAYGEKLRLCSTNEMIKDLLDYGFVKVN